MSTTETVATQPGSETLFWGYSDLTPTKDEKALIDRLEKPLEALGAKVLGVSHFDINPYHDIAIDDEAFHVEQLTKETPIPIPRAIVERAKQVKAAGVQATTNLIITGVNSTKNLIWHEIVSLVQTDTTPGKERCLMISLGEWKE